MKSTTTVATIAMDQYTTTLRTDHHKLLADEPVNMGGKDFGPDPGDLMRMSLASCTAITLRMYADRKKFDVQEIQVRVVSEELAGETLFTCGIEITGSLDESQRERMLGIAKACPVHKSLTRPIRIETVLSPVEST